MQYKKELDFCMELLENAHIACHITPFPASLDSVSEYGITAELLKLTDIKKHADIFENIQYIFRTCKPNTIYRISDEFLCHYILFQLPETDGPLFAVIGPYALTDVMAGETPDGTDRPLIPSWMRSGLEVFYQGLPVIPDENLLTTMVNTLGAHIWGSLDNFSLQDIHHLIYADIEPVAERPDTKEPEDAFLSMKVLEDRYALENNLMLAVSQGQTHKAEMYFGSFSHTIMEQRASTPVRNLKNYTIILNTLLRKTAEAGAVHPLHIDSLSSRFARKIESLTSKDAIYALQKKMIYKYCLLVKNHSMKGYSLLIQKVLTRIDSDLTADLSLKTEAELLNVNSSYLSTLFKKETGSTLTEYVNRKRIDHGIFLLNSTNLQIQAVAQQCGMPDVNYFTKTFKKFVGKTPKEYRDKVHFYK